MCISVREKESVRLVGTQERVRTFTVAGRQLSGGDFHSYFCKSEQSVTSFSASGTHVLLTFGSATEGPYTSVMKSVGTRPLLLDSANCKKG